MIFAHAVHVGDRVWNLKEASDILVTVSEELNIIVPANEVGPAVYIDVLLDAVSEISFENALVPDSQQSTYGVVINLGGEGTTNCILNATGHAEHHLALAFSSQKDANTLKRLLIQTSLGTNRSASHRRSVAIDASERILSDDELAAPGPALSDNRMLLKTALQDHAIDFHGNVISTIDPSMLERVRPSQRTSPTDQQISSNAVSEHDEDRLILGDSVEMAAEGIDVSKIDVPQNDNLVEQAIDGIDVSQVDGSSYGEFARQDIQPDASGNRSFNARVENSRALDNGKHNTVERSDGLRATRPSSSLRLNTGLNTVEDVVQFHARTSQKAGSSTGRIEMRRDLEGQHGEHNDLYYASPKIKKGHQKSPGILAKEGVPRTRERPLEIIARQASARKVPPIKLNRKLRNAQGVVETNTEQTADDGLTALTKNDAVDVKASGSNRKDKASAPRKVRKGMQYLTEHGRRTAQSRGKEVANEEQQGSDLGGDTENAGNTRLKATKAPRKNQKKARPIPTKASDAASTRGSASKSRDGPDSDPRVQVSLPDGLDNRKVDEDDDTIWDIDQVDDKQACETPRQSRQPAKTVKNQDISKTEQARSLAQLHSRKTKANKASITQNQKSLGRVAGAKHAPATLAETRPRRTAAIKANKKIQGLERSDDEIVDDDEPVPAPTRSEPLPPSTTAKRGEAQEIRNGRDEGAASSANFPSKKHSTKDFIPDSISPDSSDKRNPDATSDAKANGSSDKVILIKDTSAETLRATAGDKRMDLRKELATSGVETSAKVLNLGHGEHSNQADRTPVEQRARDSFAQLHEPIVETETETAHISFQPDKEIAQGHNDLNATSGLVNQEHVLDVVPCRDDEPLEPRAFPDKIREKVARSQAPTAPMAVKTRQTKILQRPSEPEEKSPPKPNSTRRDPFASKLNASMAQAKDKNSQTKSSKVSGVVDLRNKAPNTSISAEPERVAQEVEATTLEAPEVPPSGGAMHVKSAGKVVKSSVRVDDDDKRSLIQTSKRTGEKPSTSVPETKRKTEQVRDTSNKRVKVGPRERLDGVFARKSGFNAEKTPLVKASNKPLVIGFSASGPRNQGTISTKKSKIAKPGRTGPYDPVESRREHHVSIEQVETDFTSNQGALEPTSDEIQASVQFPRIAQTRDRTSPWQSQHAEIVSAVATGGVLTEEKGAAKRKLAPFVDDPAPWEHEQLSKRQKRDSRTPPTAQDNHPRKLPGGMFSTLVHDRPQRLSSQNTRVNENGSPMPFFVVRKEGREADDQSSDQEDGKDALAEARLEEQTVLQDDELVQSEPILPFVPLVSANSASDSRLKAYQNLTSNTKQVPSSPHASSAFGSMPAHHLYHDGKIANAETKEFIVRNEPQDPFLDPFLSASQKPPNAFMNALRRLTVSVAKDPISAVNDKKNPGDTIIHQNADVGEDPEKTLVEPHSRKRRKQVQVSDSSSSSQSGSSTQASQPDESCGEESELETETRWRKELEPHQDNMLECLLTISHVSNDLKVPLAMH